MKRLEWFQEHKANSAVNPYRSVDPAPPAEEKDVGKLRLTLLDESQSLFERYQAMFALRNIGGEAAVLALADGKQLTSFSWGRKFSLAVIFFERVEHRIHFPECIMNESNAEYTQLHWAVSEIVTLGGDSLCI